jgi:hypothetical protein
MYRAEPCVRLARRLAICAVAIAALGISSSVRAQVVERVTAPDFDLARVLGGSMKSDDLKGNVVVVDFIATWRPPMHRGAADLQRAVRENPATSALILQALLRFFRLRHYSHEPFF